MYCICTARVLFYSQTQRQEPEVLFQSHIGIGKTRSDIKSHSITTSHQTAKSKNGCIYFNIWKAILKNFIHVVIFRKGHCYEKPRVSKFYHQVVLSFVMQGLVLGCYRYDSTTVDKKHQGNLRSLLYFRIDTGDKVLEEHLTKYPNNVSYISKTTQTELLYCLKKYILDKIIKDIREQSVGPMFSSQADEVTDKQ